MEPSGASAEAPTAQDAPSGPSQQPPPIATPASSAPYRPLNVKDALGYLDSVKMRFKCVFFSVCEQQWVVTVLARSEPEVYNDFL
jgi:hypothetical protein